MIASLPDFINHLIPIVEMQMSTPAANNFGNSGLTTGTINLGAIWVGTYFQVAQKPCFRSTMPAAPSWFPRPAAPLPGRRVPAS